MFVSSRFKAISDSTSAALATSEASVVHTSSSGLSRVGDAHHSSFALHVTHSFFFYTTSLFPSIDEMKNCVSNNAQTLKCKDKGNNLIFYQQYFHANITSSDSEN